MESKTYKVRGDKDLGYSIAIPTGELTAMEYKIVPVNPNAGFVPGTLIYIPVKP